MTGASSPSISTSCSSSALPTLRFFSEMFGAVLSASSVKFPFMYLGMNSLSRLMHSLIAFPIFKFLINLASSSIRLFNDRARLPSRM